MQNFAYCLVLAREGAIEINEQNFVRGRQRTSWQSPNEIVGLLDIICADCIILSQKGRLESENNLKSISKYLLVYHLF